tara:strand:+ start:10047 stop:10760 length:714 start_codon:yes stop_codon:yes gene_type:complete
MLGLAASAATATSIGGWNPSRLQSLLMWFRFNHGIVLDGEGDVIKWTNQHNISRTHGDVHVEQDGGALTSPIQNADGSIEFDHTANSLRFKSGGSNTELNLGAFSMYWRIKFKVTDTISSEDLAEKDGNNFFKIVSPTATRTKVGGTRADWTHSEIQEGTKITVGFERNSSGTMQSYVDGVAGEVDEEEGNVDIGTTLDLTQFGKPVNNSFWYTVVICNNALTTDERSLLNSYLDNL